MVIPAYPPINCLTIPLRFQEVTRLQRTNTGIEGFGRGDIKKGSKIIYSLPVRPGIDIRHLQQGRDLTTEGKAVAVCSVKQRLDAEPIPRQNQPPQPFI